MTNEIITTIPIDLSLALYHRDEAHRYSKLALSYAKKAAQCWVKFYDSTQKLYTDGAHLNLSMTWKHYCIEYLGVTASRIRQLRYAMPLALAIESDCGIVPSEWQLREMPKHFADSDPQFTSAVFQVATKMANGGTPKKKHYEGAERVIQDLVTHNGQVDIGNGLTHFDAALVQEDYEMMMRQKEHIKSASQFKTVARYAVTSTGYRQRSRHQRINLRQRGLRINAPQISPHMLLLIREEKS